MKARIGALAVGLAADCDAAEAEVERILVSNLPGEDTLPFAGFLTVDLRWVGGFSGFRDEKEFLSVLEAAEKSPLVEATEAVRKQFRALAEKAGKAVEKGDWKAVVAAGREAADLAGRCPERAALAESVDRARRWAAASFETAVKAAREGRDLSEARKALNEVRKHFGGEPEAAEADAGLKAIQRLSNIRAVEEGSKRAPQEVLREKAAKEYGGTRWAAVFEWGEPAPAVPPGKDAPEDGE